MVEHHGAEVPTVEVRATRDGPAIVLTPLDESGLGLFTQLLARPGDHDVWHFGGSKYRTPRIKDLVIGLFFTAGGTRTERHEGNVSFHAYPGGVSFYLAFSDDTDEAGRYGTLDYAYYSGILMSPHSAPEAVRLLADRPCKVCAGPLSESTELEWEVCNACSALCAHDYQEGLGKSHGMLVVLPFCQICGRAEPGWQPDPDPWVGIADAVTKGGLNAVVVNHTDNTSTLVLPESDPDAED